MTRECQFVDYGRVALSRHRRALQISANGQRTCIELLQLSDRRVEIKLPDVTDNQSRNAGVAGNTTDDCRRSMKGTTCACCNGEMHDQDIRSLRELDEPRVGTGLIGAEY